MASFWMILFCFFEKDTGTGKNGRQARKVEKRKKGGKEEEQEGGRRKRKERGKRRGSGGRKQAMVHFLCCLATLQGLVLPPHLASLL